MPKRVLIVEEEPGALDWLEALLQGAGHGVDVCDGVDRANACLETAPTGAVGALPDLVVLDLQTYGREFARHREPGGEPAVSTASLAAGLAHEMKNPLSAVVMGARILRRSLGSLLSAEQVQLIDTIVKESRRLNGILEDFVRYTRPVPLRTSEQDLALLVEEGLGLLEAELKDARLTERYRLRRQVHEVPTVPADHDQLQHVLHTLLRNALDRMPTGGELVAIVEPLAGSVDVSIRDSGPALDRRATEQLFVPFTDDRRDATGLGLPICRRIVEAHGGTLWVEPCDEPGATFRFRLPVRDAHLRTPSTERVPEGT
jgi:signal transduction histidine kinase